MTYGVTGEQTHNVRIGQQCFLFSCCNDILLVFGFWHPAYDALQLLHLRVENRRKSEEPLHV